MKVIQSNPKELQKYAEQWAKGTIPHLYVYGYPGTGKTTAIQQALEKQNLLYVVWGNHITPTTLRDFLIEWNNRGVQLVVFDDVDSITTNDKVADILKQAMAGTGKRTITWGSTYGAKNDGTTPMRFELDKMRFCILTNRFRAKNQHHKAIQSRSVMVEYTPTPKNTLIYAEKEGIITKTDRKKIENIGFPASGVLDLRDLAQIKIHKAMDEDWEAIYKQNIGGQW